MNTERFEFGKVLGHGGMATVYRAFDKVAERDVAIKVLHAHLREHPILVAHFRQELVIAQSLEHPHIVRIDSLIDSPEMLALVMELHGTHDLKQHVQRYGPMSVQQVDVVARQVFSALEAAHAQQIVHQDIKPHNILWDAVSETAKLIDFGLARLDERIALARPEVAMGTVEYSAPEQFEDFGVDARADLYSLGITLFELLSGSVPYRGATAASVIQMHQEAPVADVRVFVRAVPDRMAETLLRTMAKAPENRFSSVAEMRDGWASGIQSGLVESQVMPEWELCKMRYHVSPLVPNNYQYWNLYLPANPQGYDQAQKDVVKEVFQAHQTHARGELQVEVLLEKARESGLRKPIPFARGLEFSQVEKMRYELGRAGISAKKFSSELGEEASKEAVRWKRLERLRKIPDFVNPVTLAIMTVVSYFGVELARANDDPWLLTLVLLVWFALFLRVCFSFGLHKTAPSEAWVHDTLLDADDYWLQFNAPAAGAERDEAIRKEQAEGLLKRRHARAYWQLRSHRMRASYERVVVKLLERFADEEGAGGPGGTRRVRRVLGQATDIAERITRLEQHLAAQNYPTLFEQLASLDAQIARSADTDRTAELIEQKTVLRRHLDEIDSVREELKALGHALIEMGEQFGFSAGESEVLVGPAF